MPKSRTRKNHSQKVAHQRMIDKHRSEKIRKENEKKYKEFEEMIASHRESVSKRRSEYAKTLAESTNEPTNTELIVTSMQEAISIE